MTKEQLVKLFDHTCLYAYATEAHMKKLCDEARAYNFAMVAVNSVQVKLCKKFLKDTDVHVGAAIGFPLGQTTIASKVFETVDAIQNGADEIDYVIPGNDDAIRAIKLFVTAMAEACLEGEAMRKDSKNKDAEEELKKAADAEAKAEEAPAVEADAE